jgi:hypothetical protein
MTTMTATAKQDHLTYREVGTPSPSGSTLEPEDTDRSTPRLQIRRQDIEFRDVAPDRIEITIKVTNAGTRSSLAERAVIQAAPLGAFVPWQPIISLPVPPLEPGQSTILQTEAQRYVPRPLGDFGRLPPSRILTAMGFDEDRSRSTEGPRRRLLQRVHGFPRLFGGSRKTDSQLNPELPTLPANPLDLLARGNVYWAGNLNVFIGDQAVERHRASQLRIEPERTNIVMFFVGDGRPDRYRFDLTGLDRRWEATIIRPTSDVPFSRTLSDGQTIKPGSWVPIHQSRLLIMALRPPAQCRQAEIEVHVCQESTQRSALVEFTFDARAAGSGCYVVG